MFNMFFHCFVVAFCCFFCKNPIITEKDRVDAFRNHWNFLIKLMVQELWWFDFCFNNLNF